MTSRYRLRIMILTTIASFIASSLLVPLSSLSEWQSHTAYAQTSETLSVPFAETPITVQTHRFYTGLVAIHISGVSTVVGCATSGWCGTFQSDAFYNFNPGAGGSPYFQNGGGTGSIFINSTPPNINVFWPNYSQQHEYALTQTVNNEQLAFRIGSGSFPGGQYSGGYTVTVTGDEALPPTDTTKPTGSWISPDSEYVAANSQLHLSVHASDDAGGSGIAYVDFRAHFDGTWNSVCTDATSNPGTDVFECDWSMTASGILPGHVDISFDVYDRAGNAAVGPGGIRRVYNKAKFVCIGAYIECNGVPRPNERPPHDVEQLWANYTMLSDMMSCVLEVGGGPLGELASLAITINDIYISDQLGRNEVKERMEAAFSEYSGYTWNELLKQTIPYSCLESIVDVVQQAVDCYETTACRQSVAEKLGAFIRAIDVWSVSDASPRAASALTMSTGPTSLATNYATWMWGPASNTPLMFEPYYGARSETYRAESLDNWRMVIYFDKSRMEITDPTADPNSEWYVTNGLLAQELITGNMQVGDAIWFEMSPANVNVAGDADDPTGPTYATFYGLAYEAQSVGSVINQRIDRNGNVTEDSGMDWRDVRAQMWVPETSHTVAGPFWDFMNATGYESPFYVTGLPITEAYWATVKVGGTYKDVLMQCFERRCLTYTPDNALEWRVEMGNVGRHYYTWRYERASTPVQPVPELPAQQVIATGLNGPRGLFVTADGTVYISEAGTGGDHCVTLDDISYCSGNTGSVTRIANGSQSRVVSGLPSWSSDGGGDSTGPQDIVVNSSGQMFAVVGLGLSSDDRSYIDSGNSVLGTIISISSDGTWNLIADIAGYEKQANPDGADLDSNPFSIVLTNDGFFVSDSGMNAILHVSTSGEISTLSVLSAQLVDAPAFLGLPAGTQIPMQSVPTGIVMGPNNAVYAGEFTGFPFVPGDARVWRLTPSGGSLVAEGFTNIIDVAIDSRDNLYVLEMYENGLLGADSSNASTMAGALIKVAPDGSKTKVQVDGLISPTGMALGPDDSIYISNNGLSTGKGEVIRVKPQ